MIPHDSVWIRNGVMIWVIWLWWYWNDIDKITRLQSTVYISCQSSIESSLIFSWALYSLSLSHCPWCQSPTPEKLSEPSCWLTPPHEHALLPPLPPPLSRISDPCFGCCWSLCPLTLACPAPQALSPCLWLGVWWTSRKGTFPWATSSAHALSSRGAWASPSRCRCILTRTRACWPAGYKPERMEWSSEVGNLRYDRVTGWEDGIFL